MFWWFSSVIVTKFVGTSIKIETNVVLVNAVCSYWLLSVVETLSQLLQTIRTEDGDKSIYGTYTEQCRVISCNMRTAFCVIGEVYDNLALTPPGRGRRADVL